MITYAQVVKRGIPALTPVSAPVPSIDPVQEEYDKEWRNEQRYLEQREFFRKQLPIKKKMVKDKKMTRREFKAWKFENEPLPFY